MRKPSLCRLIFVAVSVFLVALAPPGIQTYQATRYENYSASFPGNYEIARKTAYLQEEGIVVDVPLIPLRHFEAQLNQALGYQQGSKDWVSVYYDDQGQQHSGSFKYVGVYHELRTKLGRILEAASNNPQGDDARKLRNGLIFKTTSTGNHARGLVWALTDVISHYFDHPKYISFQEDLLKVRPQIYVTKMLDPQKNTLLNEAVLRFQGIIKQLKDKVSTSSEYSSTGGEEEGEGREQKRPKQNSSPWDEHDFIVFSELDLFSEVFEQMEKDIQAAERAFQTSEVQFEIYGEHGGVDVLDGYGNIGLRMVAKLRELASNIQDDQMAYLLPVAVGGPVGAAMGAKEANSQIHNIVVNAHDVFTAFVDALEREVSRLPQILRKN